MIVPNFKILGAVEIFDEKFYWRERKKWTNKWNNKHEDADTLLQIQQVIATCIFVPNFRILGAVIPEKSWMKHFIGEKDKMGK